MNQDTVYQLLVEANPVPDPDAVGAPSSDTAVRSHIEGSTTVQNIQLEPTVTPDGNEPNNHRWLLVGAAAVVAILVGTLFVFNRNDDTDPVPADQSVVTEPAVTEPVVTQATDAEADAVGPRQEQAIAIATQFLEAVHAGDVDTVYEMSNAETGDRDADREMWEANAVSLELGETREITSCEVDRSTPQYVAVHCTVVTDEPVWVATGVGEHVVATEVYDDGTVQWRRTLDGGFTYPSLAYVDYLRAYQPAQYAAACDADARFLAQTPECARLYAPLADEVAQWIADGKPLPDK